MPAYRYAHRLAALLLVALLDSQFALASCGASVCSVNSEWETQGIWTGPGLRIDARIEATDFDRLQSGHDRVAPTGVLGTIDENRTLNRNLLLGFDYAMNPEWAVAMQWPLIQREHLHTVNNLVPMVESWNLSGLGDVRASLRRQFTIGDRSGASVQAGVKFPTGSTDEANASGAVAERALQPGSGTTDVLVGAAFRHRLRDENTTFFLEARGQQPLREYDGYAPGRQINLDLGAHYALNFTSGVLLQINLLDKAHDHGVNAEPAETGGQYVFLSPGYRQTIAHNWQVYGFVQFPLYQYVNGTQLTANRSLVVGVSWQMYK